MFNKRNRKFKSRRKDDIIDLSEEREEDIIEIDVEPAYQLINRSKPAKSNTTSILSFDNEEGSKLPIPYINLNYQYYGFITI